MSPIIDVNNLTKEYRLGQLASLKDTAINKFRQFRRLPTIQREVFTALSEVSFTIEPGEVVGIIGHNGAGKSTLLKILAGIVTPTHGTISVNSNVAPLIELGAGLVPDLTGRENVFLNAAIFGMNRSETLRRFDEIVAFAELSQFIDTPIKRYSSGMQVRLGFAIATTIDAEILIIDEVLSVGDLAFQRKCFDRLEHLIKRQGRTVLLVSHNIRQVVRICDRAILLEQGKIAVDGNPEEVCDTFYTQSNRRIVTQRENATEKTTGQLTSGEAFLQSIDIFHANSHCHNEVVTGENCTIRAVFEITKPLNDIEIAIGFHTTDFIYISSMDSSRQFERIDLSPGLHIIHCEIECMPLRPGVYALRAGIYDKALTKLFYGETLKVFAVRSKNHQQSKFLLKGLIDISAQWSIEKSG